MKKLRSHSAGFSLLEVMIAVVVLAFGLISLAALQSRLFQAGAESKARTTATAIAQQMLEDARSFAFVSPPSKTYGGDTYVSLATTPKEMFQSGGVDFDATRTVVRYRYDKTTSKFVANATEAYSGGTPEFKQVNVSVGWAGSDGERKSVLLTDSIAAVAPADAAMLRQIPTESAEGPKVYIQRPDINNPQVVPIGIGNDQSAASSNPKPEQFIEDISAATQFSVMTYTGSGNEVLLGRKLDVAAVSCVCQEGGKSSATDPAYQPVEWNGRQRAYQEPQTLPEGTDTGIADVSDKSAIASMCTVCCRDHHEAGRKPAVDPWRDRSQNGDSSEHYGYKGKNGNYDVGGGLLPTSDTGGFYLDACQIIRVGGRPRLARDLMQTHLLATPLNDSKTGYQVDNFSGNYAAFVKKTITDGMANLPAGYPSPTAKFPSPTTTPSNLRTPLPIQFATAGQKKNLVAFGLYLDYLNKDTIDAYNCVVAGNNSGDCSGLGITQPDQALQVLPFYAVNVANLGSWRSEKPLVASVVDANYKNATDGGLVTAQSGTSTEFPVALKINNSNSGLASTAPVDKDDRADSSYATDSQGFQKGNADPSSLTAASLVVGIAQTSMLKLDGLSMSPDAANTLGNCSKFDKNSKSTCGYYYVKGQTSTLQLTISGYTTSKITGQTVTISDRMVCVANDPRISVQVVPGTDGTTGDTTIITITQSPALLGDYALTINIVDQGPNCPGGPSTLTP